MKLTKHLAAESVSPSGDADSELFKRLFKLHAPGIYRLAYKKLGDRTEAQEIVQECFLKFWEKRQQVSPDLLAIKGYLYTSAYHAILNQARQQKWIYEDYPENLATEQVLPLAELEYQELTGCYLRALAQLPTKRREIFAMSRQQGLSNATIAQELNISIKTVEAQITQALKFLRAYFQQQGIAVALLLLVLQD